MNHSQTALLTIVPNALYFSTFVFAQTTSSTIYSETFLLSVFPLRHSSKSTVYSVIPSLIALEKIHFSFPDHSCYIENK